ncbi:MULTISPECIES: PRC-barrel domain containing protein [unclassified Streptomyces]|uniref:PRC-barrel domain containing protein n=1 Tax=unclassified Streptomyces TaxID=2593676 RepID=UPI00365CE9BB
MTIDRIWSYPPQVARAEEEDLTGFTVVAADGTVGHVDREGGRSGMRHLVVDTGVWVFGRSVMVPAGMVAGIDSAERRITVACSRGQIKAAPRFRTDSETRDPEYLTRVGAYYQALPPSEATSA